MDPRRDEDQATVAAEQALAAISCESCPPAAEALTAVASAWRPVDREEIDASAVRRWGPILGLAWLWHSRATVRVP